MAENSSRITRMDPDDPEKVLVNTESHIENAVKPEDDASEVDFWLKQDFTMVSEAEEAESRILSPDSESVLKNAAQGDPGNTFRGNRSLVSSDRTTRTPDKSDTIVNTRDGLEMRRALARQQQQQAAPAQNAKQASARGTAASGRPASEEKTAVGVKRIQSDGRIPAPKNAAAAGTAARPAGTAVVPAGNVPEKKAPAKGNAASTKTALGVKKITSPAGKSSPAKKAEDTMTAAGVRRIPQTPERARAARESRIRNYKKERSAKIRKVIINIVCWLLVIGLCIAAFMLGYRLFNDIPVDEEDISKITVSISGLENDEEMADFLEEYDLINDKFMYKLRCKIYDADYQEGTYKLSRSYTTEKIINILSGFKAYADGTLEED